MKKIDARTPAPYWILALVGLVAIGLAQPIFLFLVWRLQISGNVAVVANDLGALMGAIFTAGGLVVALISIYTMASVDTVTRRAIEPVLASVAVDIDLRIKRYLEAYGYFTRAQAVNGWTLDVMENIESLVREALKLQPEITGLHSWTASRLFQMSATKFFPWIYPQYYNDGVQKTLRTDISPFVAHAIQWANGAVQNGDGDRPLLYRQLAALHGMLGDSSRAVRRYIALANSSGANWNNPMTVAFLLISCRSEDDAQEILRSVNVSPLGQSEIRARIEEKVADDLRRSNAFEQYVDFLVFPRATEADPPYSPGTVRVLYQGEAELGLATWTPSLQTGAVLRREGIPKFAVDTTGQPTSAPPIALDSVIAQLLKQFLVIVDWGPPGKNWFLEEL